MTSRELKHMAKLREWETKITECRSSCKKVQQWCSENGINAKTYHYWEKQYLLECDKIKSADACNSLVRIEPDKLPAAGLNNKSSGNNAIILTAGSVKLELPVSISAEQVAALVAAINRNV